MLSVPTVQMVGSRREGPGQPLPCCGQDQEEQMHTSPSACLFPVYSETNAPALSLTCASGVSLMPAGHRWSSTGGSISSRQLTWQGQQGHAGAWGVAGGQKETPLAGWSPGTEQGTGL